MKTNSQAARSRSKGFSLIETLMGIALGGIAFVSLYAGVSGGFSVLQVTRENLRATQIMVEKMETIRLYNWTQVNQSGFIPTSFTEKYNPLSDDGGGVLFSGRLVIANAPFTTSYSGDIRLVRIELEWESGGVKRQREMSSLITRNGLQNYIY